MINKNSLASVAMLASIWEKEQKDVLDLILPFVQYAIGKSISGNGEVITRNIADFVSKEFGFVSIPDSVFIKIFNRLKKKEVLFAKNKKFFLNKELKDFCESIDAQHNLVKHETDQVLSGLTEYLSHKKTSFRAGKIDKEAAIKLFLSFLDDKGYFMCVDVPKINDILFHDPCYMISRFIVDEQEKKSNIFNCIDNIAKGFLLSKIIYGYSDFQCSEKMNDLCVYLDTSLLLGVFGFKSTTENTLAKQLVAALHENNILVKCFSHNYNEVHGIIKAYRNSLLKKNRINVSAFTLEYFDENQSSIYDIDMVLASLDEYFKKNIIEIVSPPTLSSNNSGRVTKDDFCRSIGEGDLVEALRNSINYKNDSSLQNDVKSISSVFVFRNGEFADKLEKCKALFVTKNIRLVKTVVDFCPKGSFPLLIDDLELTTILWLKNNKKTTPLPTLKLIEITRLALEPNDEILASFVDKIEKNKEIASGDIDSICRLLSYKKREKLMDLIDGDPGNIDQIDNNKLRDLVYKSGKIIETNDHVFNKEDFLDFYEKDIKKKSVFVFGILKKLILFFILLMSFVSVLGFLMTINRDSFFSFYFNFFTLTSIISIAGIWVSVYKSKYVDFFINIFLNKWINKKIKEKHIEYERLENHLG